MNKKKNETLALMAAHMFVHEGYSEDVAVTEALELYDAVEKSKAPRTDKNLLAEVAAIIGSPDECPFEGTVMEALNILNEVKKQQKKPRSKRAAAA